MTPKYNKDLFPQDILRKMAANWPNVISFQQTPFCWICMLHLSKSVKVGQLDDAGQLVFMNNGFELITLFALEVGHRPWIEYAAQKPPHEIHGVHELGVAASKQWLEAMKHG